MTDVSDICLIAQDKCSKNLTIEQKNQEVAIRQTEALTSLAKGVNDIATFLTSGGLTEILSGYARSQAVKDILGGLAARDGRQSLDARVLKQNAIEITHAVEAVFRKYQEVLTDKELRDPEIHKATEPFETKENKIETESEWKIRMGK